jgi:hypothetical protein
VAAGWEQGADLTSAAIWAVIVSVIVVPTIVRRRSSIGWAGALPVAWLGVMSLFVARLVPLFGEGRAAGIGRCVAADRDARPSTGSG